MSDKNDKEGTAKLKDSANYLTENENNDYQYKASQASASSSSRAEDEGLAKVRAQNYTRSTTPGVQAIGTPSPSLEQKEDTALAKARAQNPAGKATMPGVQSVTAGGAVSSSPSPSTAPAERQRLIQEIIKDSSLLEDEKRKRIQEVMRRGTGTAGPAAVASSQSVHPTAGAAAASSNVPDNKYDDIALAKARATNTFGKATLPGVQSIGAAQAPPPPPGPLLSVAERQKAIQAIIKDGSLSEDAKRKKIQEVMKGGIAAVEEPDRRVYGAASAAVLSTSAKNVGMEDAALAKARARNVSGPASSPGVQAVAAAASGSLSGNEEEEDAAIAKARARNAAGPVLTPGAKAVSANFREEDASLAKARAHGSATHRATTATHSLTDISSEEDSPQDAALAKARARNSSGPATYPGIQLLAAASQDTEGKTDDLHKSQASDSDRRLRKEGTIAKDPYDDFLPSDSYSAKEVPKDSYYDGYDAPEAAQPRAAYGVGTYIMEHNTNMATVVEQVQDEYAAPTALAAEAVTYAMDVKEIIPEAEVQKKEKRNIYRKWLIVAILAVCLAVPATVTAVVLLMNKAAPTSNPYGATPIPTTAPTAANHQQFQVFLTSTGVSSEEDMADPLSPQNQALRWITTEDPMQLNPEDNSAAFVQRYTMATLYYSTNGDSWAQCHKDDVQSHCMDGRQSVWLSDTPECEWAGIGCNGNSMVAMISIGKFMCCACCRFDIELPHQLTLSVANFQYTLLTCSARFHPK
jgi:hypothetical protein